MVKQFSIMRASVHTPRSPDCLIYFYPRPNDVEFGNFANFPGCSSIYRHTEQPSRHPASVEDDTRASAIFD